MIGRGADTTGALDNSKNPIGTGGGYFLDPTPLDNSEFTGSISNAFAGYANATASDGKADPASGQNDLYELVLHELGHAVGFADSADLRAHETDTKAVDTISGIRGTGTTGDLWRFDSASVQHLMTSFDSGGGSSPNSSNAGIGWHSALDGSSYKAPDGTVYTADDELMSPYYAVGRQRRLISDPLALMLQDAYGYTIALPSTFATYYAVLNQQTGALFVTGGSGTMRRPDRYHANEHRAHRERQPGQRRGRHGCTGWAGNLPAFVTHLPIGSVNSININAGDGDDSITVQDYVPKLTIGLGAGNDTVDVTMGDMGSGPTSQTVNITTGSGSDTVERDGLDGIFDGDIESGRTDHRHDQHEWERFPVLLQSNRRHDHRPEHGQVERPARVRIHNHRRRNQPDRHLREWGIELGGLFCRRPGYRQFQDLWGKHANHRQGGNGQPDRVSDPDRRSVPDHAHRRAVVRAFLRDRWSRNDVHAGRRTGRRSHGPCDAG